MRIIQIIDTLHAGGAERMAVNYANALANKISFSGLIATRSEGDLLHQLDKNVNYLFLNKKNSLDFKAVLKLKRYIKANKINIIHAHGTSFFIAVLVKIIYPKIAIIWHDHYGDSEFLSTRPKLILKLICPFFQGIIAVNQKLFDWSKNELKVKNTIYLSNFTSIEDAQNKTTLLKGISKKRIVCLANLRAQKNQFLILEMAHLLKIEYPNWSFHLVGKNFNDSYSLKLINQIQDQNLSENIFIYDSKSDISNILDQAEIAILTSKSEGLPVALLEYGLKSKAVIATNVGEISTIINNAKNGFLVPSNNAHQFYDALKTLISNPELRLEFGNNLKNTIQNTYAQSTIIAQYLKWLKNIYYEKSK